MDFRKKIKDSIKNRLNKNKIYGAGGGGRSAPPPPQPQIVRQTTVVQSAQAGTNVPPRKPPKLVPPSKEGGRLFESVSSLSILDLVGEGPIEGFVNEDGTKAVGSEILSSIYYNNATIKEQQKRKLVTAELNNQLIGKTGYYESIVNDLESTSGVFEFLSTLPADLKDKKAKEIEDYRNELFDLNLSGNKAIGYIRFDLNGDINSVFANRQVKATNFSDVYLNAYFGSKENIYQRFIKTDEGETKELPENKFFGAILRDTNGNRITERGIMDQIYDVNGVTGFGYFFFWTNGRSLDECINGNPSSGDANNYDVFSIDSQEFKLQTTGSTVYPDIDEMINSGIGLSMIIDDPLNFNYLNTEIDFRLGEEDQRPLGDLSLGTRYFTVNQQILGPFRADGNAQRGDGNNDVRKGGNFATWQELLPPDENEFSYTHIIYQNEVENAIPTLAINSLRDTQAQARGGDEGEGVGRTLPQTLNIRVEYGFEGGDIPLGFEPIPANSRAIIEPSDYTLFYVKQARTENNLLERKYKLEFESGDAEFEGSYEFASNLNFARKITIDEENSSEYVKSFVGIYNFLEETEREIVYGKIKLAPDNRFDIYYFLIFDKNTRKWSAVDANFFSQSESVCAEAQERQIISLTAPEGYTFTSVDFASYGTPNGECGNYSIGSCHASNSQAIVESYLLGQTGTVEIPVNNSVFGDPCQGTEKRLYLEVTATNGYEPNNYGVYSAFVENPSFNLDNSIDALDGLSMSGIDLEVSGGQVIVNFNPFKDIKNIKVEDFRSVLYAELNDPDHMIIYNKSEREWVAYDEGRTGEASFVGTLPTTLRQNFEFLEGESFEPSYSGANPPQNMSVDVLLGLFPEIVQGNFSNLKLRPTGEGASLVDVTPDTELTQFGITSGDIGAPFYCVKDFDIIQPGFGYRNKEDLNLKINNEYLLKPEIENAISISNGKVVKNNNAFSAGLVRNAFIDFDSQIISQDDIFFERGAGKNFNFGTELANLDEATGENGKVTISYLELAATGASYENLFKKETSEIIFDGNQPITSTSLEQVEKYETNRSAIVTQPFSLEGDSNGYSMAFVGWLRLDEGTPQQTIADVQTTSEIDRLLNNRKYKLDLSDPEISGFLQAELFKLDLDIIDNVNYDQGYEKYSGIYKIRRDEDGVISFAQIKNSDIRINFNKNNKNATLRDFFLNSSFLNIEQLSRLNYYNVSGFGNDFDGFYYKANVTEENDFAQEIVFAKENDVSRKIVGKISGDASIGSVSGEEITLDTKITVPYMQLAGTGSGYFELFSGRIFDGNQTIETPLNSLEEYDVERPAIITNEITTRDFYDIGIREGDAGIGVGFDSMVYDSSRDVGYFGEINISNITQMAGGFEGRIDGESIANQFNLTTGESINKLTNWHKFYVGKNASCNRQGNPYILYIAEKSMRCDVSWDDINNAGLVDGSNSINILGKDYSIRLMQGADSDPSTYGGGTTSCTDNAGGGSEWNELFYRICEDIPDCSNPTIGITGFDESVNHGGPQNGSNFANLTIDDLNINGFGDSSGSFPWCQEEDGTNSDRHVIRGIGGVAIYSTADSDAKSSFRGWRPCLQIDLSLDYSMGFGAWLSIDPDSPKQVIASVDSEDELLRKKSLRQYEISGATGNFQDEANFDVFQLDNVVESYNNGYFEEDYDYRQFAGQYRTISTEQGYYDSSSRAYFKTDDFSKNIIVDKTDYEANIGLVDLNNEQKVLESCRAILYNVDVRGLFIGGGLVDSSNAYMYDRWDGIYAEYLTTPQQRIFAKIAEKDYSKFDDIGKIQLFFHRNLQLQDPSGRVIWFAADYTQSGINRAAGDGITASPDISGELLIVGDITGQAGFETFTTAKTDPNLTGSQQVESEELLEKYNKIELTDINNSAINFNFNDSNIDNDPNTTSEYAYFVISKATFDGYSGFESWYSGDNITPDIADPAFDNILKFLFHHTGFFNEPSFTGINETTKNLNCCTWEIAGEFYDEELKTEVIQWSLDGTTTGDYFVEFATQQEKWYLLDKKNLVDPIVATAENDSQEIENVDNWVNQTNGKKNIKLFYDAGNASRNIKNSHMSWLYDNASGTFNLVLQKSDITGDTLEKLDSAFGPKYNLNEIQNEIVFDQITGLDDGKFHFAAIGIEVEESNAKASLYIDNNKAQTITLTNNHINDYNDGNTNEFLDFLKLGHFAVPSQRSNVKLSVFSPYDNKFNSNVKLTNNFIFGIDKSQGQISGGLFKTDAEGDFEIWKTTSQIFTNSGQYENAISVLNVTQINSDKGIYNAGSAGLGWIPDSYYKFSSRGAIEPALNIQNEQIKLNRLPGLIIQGQEDTVNVDISSQIGELNLSSLIETKWVAIEYSDSQGSNPNKTETIISKTDGTQELLRPLSLVNLETALDGVNTEEFGVLSIKEEGIDPNSIPSDLSDTTIVNQILTRLFELDYKVPNKAGAYSLNVQKLIPNWNGGLSEFGYRVGGSLFNKENGVNINYWLGEYESNGNIINTSDWMAFNPSTNTWNLYNANLDNTILLQGIGSINDPTGSFYWINNANDSVLSGKNIFNVESSSREINNTSISWVVNDQGKNALSVQQNSVTDSQADKYFGPKFDANNAIEIDFDQSPDMRDGNFHFVVIGLEYDGTFMNGKLFIDKKRENNNTFPDNSGEYTKSITISDIGGNDSTNFVLGNFRNSNNARLNIFSPYDGEFNSVTKLTNYLGFFNSSTEVQIKSGLFDINNRGGNLDAEGGDFEIFDNFGNLFDNTNQKALISMFDMNPQKGVFNETTNSFIEDSRDYLVNQGTQEIAIKQKNEPMEPKRLPGIITENLINIAGLATAQSGGFEIPQELEENIPSEVFIEDLNISTAYGDAFGDLDRRWLVGYDQGIAPRDIALGLITFYEDYTFEGISDGTYLTELETNFDQEIPNNELLRNYTYGNAQAPLSILEAEGLKSTDRIFPGETWRDVNRYIKVRKMDFETESILIGRSASVFSISEYYSSRFKYPFSAMVSSTIDARTFERAPKRRYEMRFKKIKIPSNYFPLNGDGSDKRFIRLEDPKKKVYVGEWDGSFRIGWSDNPAWILYDLLTNTRYGVGTQIDDLEDIDIFELYQIGKYCDAVDDEGRFVGVVDSIGRLEPRFSCNVQLERKKNAFEIISNIAAIFRGLTYWSGGSFNFAIDKPKEIMAIFNNGNVYEGGFSYGDVTSQSRFSRVSVSYKDKYDDYKNKIEYVDDEEQIRKYGILENEHFALGSTSRSQARRVGKYILISNKIETETVTFQTGSEALLLAPGDIIKVDDELKNFEINYGKIKRLDPANNTITFKNYINSDSIKTGGGSGIYIYNGKGQKSIKSLYDVAKYEENSKFSDQEINETKTAQISKFIVSNVFEDTINKEITVEVFSEIGETLEEYMKGYDFNIQLNNDVNQLYRVIKVTQQEPSLYQVEALQHSPDKFEQIEREDYSIKENKYNIGVPANIVDRPSPPQNGSITIQNNIYGTFDAVITFDNPPDVNKIDHYLIAVDYPDTQYVTQQVKPSETGTTTAFIRELDIVGEYFVRIKSVKNPESSKEERMTFFVPAPEKIKNNFTIEKVSIFSPKERTIKNTSYLNNSKQKVRFNLEMTNLRGEEFNFKDDQSVSVDIYLMKGERKILMKENHRSNSFEVDILKQLPKGKKLQRKEHLRFRLYRKQNKAQDVHNVILKNNKCKIKNLEIFGNKFLIEQDEASMEIKKIEVYVTSENFTGRQKTITVQDGSNIIVEMNEAIDLKNNKYTLVPYDIIGKGEEYKINHSE